MTSGENLREALIASKRMDGHRTEQGRDHYMSDQTEERSLTDADVQAIANAIWRKGRDEFYADLGKGVWSAAKAVLVAALIALAAYGSWKGIK